VGNAIEVIEAAETLKGRGHRDLVCLCLELGSEMMCLAGVEKDRQRAKKILEDNIKNGKAMEKFRQIVLNQGGDPAALDDYSLLPGARFRQEVAADKSGYVKRIDAMRIGLAAMKLGAGRQKKDDVIDPGVGVWIYAKVGDRVEKGEPFARVLADDQERLKWAVDEVAQAYEFSEPEVEKRKVIRARITRDSIQEF
jgi:pyrimidine-nucleoside phosphorylase